MKYRLLSLILILALLLCACGGGDDHRRDDDVDDDERIEDRDNRDEDDLEETVGDSFAVTEVRFTYMIDESKGMEYAVITAHYEDGSIAWEHTTDRYYVAQMYQVFGMELWQDRYYYIEGGTVVALDRETGQLIWENPDFGGCPAGEDAYLITQDGTLLLTGYFGPDFIAIDRDGNTLKLTVTFDQDIFWPYAIEMMEDVVQISFEGILDGDGNFDEDGIYYVNLDPDTWEETE